MPRYIGLTLFDVLYQIKGMVKRVTNAKIACLDFSLQKTKMKMGVQVIINDPEKLDQIRQRQGRCCLLRFSCNVLHSSLPI